MFLSLMTYLQFMRDILYYMFLSFSNISVFQYFMILCDFLVVLDLIAETQKRNPIRSLLCLLP